MYHPVIFCEGTISLALSYDLSSQEGDRTATVPVDIILYDFDGYIN